MKAFDRICEVQSDKATVEITSRYDGVITAVHHDEGSIVKVMLTTIVLSFQYLRSVDVKVGSSLVDIQTSIPSPMASSVAQASASNPLAATACSSAAVAAAVDDRAKSLLTPAVRRLVKEHGIDLSLLRGTGTKGRILKEDVLRHLAGPVAVAAAAPASVPASMPVPVAPKSSAAKEPSHAQGSGVVDRVVPIRGIMRMMVKSMTASAQVGDRLL